MNIDRVYEELGSQAQVAVDSVGPASDNPDQDQSPDVPEGHPESDQHQASDVPERHPESDNSAKSKSVQSLGKSEKKERRKKEVNKKEAVIAPESKKTEE